MERVDREGGIGAWRDLSWSIGPGRWGGWVGAEGGVRGKRKESCPVGADRLLEHGNTGSHRVVEAGRLLQRDKRPRWVSDDGG